MPLLSMLSLIESAVKAEDSPFVDDELSSRMHLKYFTSYELASTRAKVNVETVSFAVLAILPECFCAQTEKKGRSVTGSYCRSFH